MALRAAANRTLERQVLSIVDPDPPRTARVPGIWFARAHRSAGSDEHGCDAIALFDQGWVAARSTFAPVAIFPRVGVRVGVRVQALMVAMFAVIIAQRHNACGRRRPRVDDLQFAGQKRLVQTLIVIE